MSFDGWEKVKLGTMMDFKNGKGIKNDLRSESGQHYIYGSNGIIGHTNEILIDKSCLIIGRVGAYCGSVQLSHEPCWVTDNAVIGLAKESVADLTFLYYFLSRFPLRDFAGGSAQPLINQKILKDIEINIPPIDEQRKIAAILTSIDIKIEHNKGINKNLQELAQSIYEHWFINFEFPNENGEAYKSSAGNFVESELGMIPEGWKVAELNSIIEITSGKRPPSKQDDKDEEYCIPLLGASSQMGYVTDILYDTPILIIGRVGTHGVIQRISDKCWPSDNTLVIQSKYYHFMYQILQRIDYASLNRGSTQPLITQGDIKNYKIVLPDVTIIDKYENIMSRLFDMIDSNEKQNKTLTNLRNSLLPKLMSGEIRIPDAEQEVEECLQKVN